MNLINHRSALRNTLTLLLLVFLTISNSNAQLGCEYTQSGQLSGSITFRSIINCPNGDVTLNDMNSAPDGSGNVIFDQDVTLNSLTINFANGNKPVEFIIPAGVTVTILTNLTFNGQPDKDKFLTVEGTLIVGGTLDFGGLEFEVEGEGAIDAGSITGADDVSCTASGTCPTITADSCNDGTGNFCDTALPIDLAYFDVVAQENMVKIKWVTATEENNDYFEILRSKDGINYNVIAKIDGAGNSTQALSYEYVDDNPLYGQSYYKLKQTDFDGKNETFSAKSVYVSTLSDLVFAPNPVKAGEPLKIFTGASEEEKVTVTILNLAGNQVYSEVLRGEEFSVNIDNQLEKGVYFLSVKSGSNQFVKRLLIK